MRLLNRRPLRWLVVTAVALAVPLSLRCAAATPVQPTPDQPTPTPTEGPEDIVMSGLVFDASIGEAAPIEGARIVVPSCPPTPHQPFQATTGADGLYELTLPGTYFRPGCVIEITASAAGYEDLVEEILYEDLKAQPERDFGLAQEPGPTPTPTEGPEDITMSGLVYDADIGFDGPIVGARVVVPSCPETPHQPFQAVTGPDGRYELVLPAAYIVPGCTVEITVSATVYEDLVQRIPYAELKDRPERDFGLLRKEDYQIHLPLASARHI